MISTFKQTSRQKAVQHKIKELLEKYGPNAILESELVYIGREKDSRDAKNELNVFLADLDKSA